MFKDIFKSVISSAANPDVSGIDDVDNVESDTDYTPYIGVGIAFLLLVLVFIFAKKG